MFIVSSAIFAQDTLPPRVYFVFPPNNSFSSCNIMPVMASIVDENGINRESVVMVINGVPINLSDPQLQLIDTLLFFNRAEPFSDGEVFNAVIVGVADTLGNSISPPYPSLHFTTDMQPPFILGHYPSYGETVHTTTPYLWFIVHDNVSGIDSGSVEINVLGRAFRIFDPAVRWHGDTILFSCASAGLTLPRGEPIDFCLRATDRVSVCSPNSVDTCILFFATSEEYLSLEVELRSLNRAHFPEVTGLVWVEDTARGLPVDGLDVTNFVVREFGEPQYPLRVIPRGGFRKVDIVVVFDNTGSMGTSIGLLRDQVVAFAESLAAVGLDYRLGIVTFKDEVALPHGRELTDNVEEFQRWIADLEASGGGDTPENSFDALNEACRMNFREDAGRIFILITDAPPHSRGDGTPFSHFTLPEIIDTLLLYDVTVFIFSWDFPEWNGPGSITDKTGGEWFSLFSDVNSIVPILASAHRHGYYVTFISNHLFPDCAPRTVTVEVEIPQGSDTIRAYASNTYIGPCAPRVELIEPRDRSSTSRTYQQIIYHIYDPDGNINPGSIALQVDDSVYTMRSRPMHFEDDTLLRYMPPDSLVNGQIVRFRLLSVQDNDGYIFEGEPSFHQFVADRQGPLAQLITPSPNSIVWDTLQRIVIQIIDSISGVNPSSIRFSVEGLLYTVGSPGVTFDPPNLIFEPSGAGIHFAPNETVNVSLLQASDSPTYGRQNPLYGAPLNWEFYIAPVRVKEPEHLPYKFSLKAVFPNPFNSTLALVIELPQRSDIDIGLYNLNGNLVAGKSCRALHPGEHNFNLDIAPLPSGMYFIEAMSGTERIVKEVILIK